MTCTLTFTAGEGTGESFTIEEIPEDTSVKLPDASFTRDGFTMVGWANGFSFYEVGYPYTVVQDETLTALYVPQDEAASFDMKALICEKARRDGIAYEGDSAHRAAVADVLARAEQGEAVTIAYLGASWMQGAGAPTGRGYVDLEREMFERDYPNVTVVNAGIGATEAVLGVGRLEEDVLAHDPDLVIVCYGTNDYGHPYPEAAYEGILRKLLSRGIAVVDFNQCHMGGQTLQDKFDVINRYYGVPNVSWKNAYYVLTDTVNPPPGFAFGNLYISDNVHPNGYAHGLLADLQYSFLKSVKNDTSLTPAPLTITLPDPMIEDGYEDAMLWSHDTENNALHFVLLDGFTADYAHKMGCHTFHGWQASEDGASVTFTTTAGYVSLFCRTGARSSDIAVYVDGVFKQTMVGYAASDWDAQFCYALHTVPGTEHTVTCVLRKNNDTGNCYGAVTALVLSNFD